MAENKVLPAGLMSDFDVSLFQSGKHFRLYEKMGAQLGKHETSEGCYFTVYAPNAYQVTVVGDFNKWNGEQHVLFPRWDKSGIWEGFIPGIKHGTIYKYKVYPHKFGRVRLKSDPYAFKMEHPPLSGSIVWNMDYSWKDKDWMTERVKKNGRNKPHSVYEVHFGSWRFKPGENRPLNYMEAAIELTEYVKAMGFTHLEFMPLAEYPYEPSWGYQVTGYYAATSRFGNPQELMYLIDVLHQNDIGVIMDWVPAHFPADDFALATFDGSCVYEHPDRRKGFHPDWNTLIFNYERNEVRSFLISNAFFWFDNYHIDGVRVDAVSSMIHLDYSRKEGEWAPNEFGGREYVRAISFIQECNKALYTHFPGIQTIAEESTDHPLVSRPPDIGGLGFGMKWMMGWMHDTLKYFQREFIYRRFHQNDITFSIMYAFSENFMLPLSHDEVVHGKASLIGKMAGDEWQKFSNLRTLYGYMFTHPGTKLLFMGSEIGPYDEWNFTQPLPWELLQFDSHSGLQQCVRDLNNLYTSLPALHYYNFSFEGFDWVNAGDFVNSILVYIRKSNDENEKCLIICNMSIKPQNNYKIGLFLKENWIMVFNSDDVKYWGSHYTVNEKCMAKKKVWQGKPYYIEVEIPPLCTLIYKKIKTSKKPSSSIKAKK
ncbi:MAG: 1,4-alpha-glucan branching protein GlgB [Saprospiraceae bacterium]|nr:1,4-alpha-glucan branching protein GlgB [Saprospiraceae bacterium]